MRDFPIFTTDYGVASLVLKEIPYKKQAFICIRDVQSGFLREHLKECVDFCKMAGAEHIYASGSDGLEAYPLYTTVVEMRGRMETRHEDIAQLFPVTEQTVGRWREIYNGRMQGVDNAGTLEKRDEQRLLSSGGTYFVHDLGALLGIGWLEGDRLLAIASAMPGAGERVMRTLLSLTDGEVVTLEVASTNHRAVRLYEKLGFLPVGEVSRWYKIL